MLRRAVLPLLVLLASAAPASAAMSTIGSDLKGTASLTQSNGSDWAAWTAGSSFVAPAKGEVASVTVKGTVVRQGADVDNFQLHVIVLRPSGGGFKIVTTSDTLKVPYGVAAGTLTTWDLGSSPAKTCVLPGDIVALTGNGGGGVPVTMFARSSATTSVFDMGFPKDDRSLPANAGVQNGVTVFPHAEQGRELLMRATIGTGPDARPYCGGTKGVSTPGPKPPTNPTSPTDPGTPAAGSGAAKIAVPKKAIKLNKVVRFKVSCPTTASCAGRIKLRGPITVTKSFTMRKGNTKTIAVTLTKKAVKTLKRRKKLKVKVTLLRADGSKQRFSIKLKRA